MKDQQFPENRPKDENGVPVKTPQQLEREAIQRERVVRESPGPYQGPVAGHDRTRERTRER